MNTKEINATYRWLRSNKLNDNWTDEQLLAEAAVLAHFGAVEEGRVNIVVKPDKIAIGFKGFSLYYACLIMYMAGDKNAIDHYNKWTEAM